MKTEQIEETKKNIVETVDEEKTANAKEEITDKEKVTKAEAPEPQGTGSEALKTETEDSKAPEPQGTDGETLKTETADSETPEPQGTSGEALKTETADSETPEPQRADGEASKTEAADSKAPESKETGSEALKTEAADSKTLEPKETDDEVPKTETADGKEPETKEADSEVSEEESPESNEEKENAEKKRGKAPKVIFAVVLSALILAAAGYFGTAFFYQSHFLPYTFINGEPCGNLEVSEVVPMIDARLNDYILTVTGRDYATCESGTLLGEIRSGDIALAYVDTKGAVEDVLTQQNAYLWPQAYFRRVAYSYSIVQGVTFDGELLRAVVNGWDACQKKNMVSPEDAYISEYNDEIGGYEIIPETEGTALDMDAVFQYLENGLYMNESSMDLEELQCYAEAARKSTDEDLQEAVGAANRWLGTKITYDWNENEVILDLEMLKDWISMDQEEPTLDEEAVAKFVKEQAKQYDTYGKRKSFVTALGVTLKLRSPNYGWKTDVEAETEELIQLIRQGSQEERNPVYSVKAAHKGVNDVGASYVEADLTHQHLYVFDGGEIVFETDFVSGKMNSTPGCVTPEGIYGLSYKTTNAVLRGADYETPVTYWMPFYGNYGMHDATWRSNFGGTIYIEHGSHGCINLPFSAAATIYEYVYTGSPVVCYYYEVDPLTTPVETEELTEEELLSQEEPTIGQSTEQAQ